jgi:hypothetical protein
MTNELTTHEEHEHESETERNDNATEDSRTDGSENAIKILTDGGSTPAEHHIEAVRELGRVVIELSQIDLPELQETDNMIVEETSGQTWIEVEQDDVYWNAWCDVYEVVTGIGSEDSMDEDLSPDTPKHQRFQEVTATGSVDGERVTSLNVAVYADGDMRIHAEYLPHRGGSWKTLYEGRLSVTAPDLVDIGREIASAELTYLVHETSSDADALDYWQTHRRDGWYSQSVWADIRGVGRQTVNDRKRSTEKAIEE